MKTIGIIYSQNTIKTEAIAIEIIKYLNAGNIDKIEVEDCTASIFIKYDYLVLGVATWFDGELPYYWDEFLPELEKTVLHNKKIAIFGLGDQKRYPENFCDGMGIVADFLTALGAEIVGQVSADDYQYESSRAVKNGLFQGLPLDQENEGRLTETRIKTWTDQLRKRFSIAPKEN